MFMSMVAEQGMFIGAGKGLFYVGRLSFSENSRPIRKSVFMERGIYRPVIGFSRRKVGYKSREERDVQKKMRWKETV